MATRNIAYGAYVALGVTALQSLANDSSDPFTAWQSERVDNISSVKATDYEIRIHIPMSANAPSGDQFAYVYLVPWVYDGALWATGGNFSTTTLPSGTDIAASISDPNSMRLAAVLPYKITSQTLQGFINLADIFRSIPDGWSLAIRNASGAAFSTGCVVEYRSITETIA